MRVFIEYKEPKKITFFVGMIWLFCYLIAITNYENADYEAYAVMYKFSETNQYWVESGYWLLEKIFYGLGIDFFWFRTIYMTIAYLLILKTIVDFSSSPKLVSLLYFLFPFLLDIVQLRNYMASAIVIYSLHFLKGRDRKGSIYFMICIFLAITQHTAAICYIILILVKFWDFNRIKNFSIYGTLGISLIFFLLYFVFPDIVIILSNIFGKTFVWEKYNMMSGLIWILAGIMLELYIVNFEPKRKNSMLHKVSLLSCIFLPIMLFRFDAYRIYRNLILVNYIILCCDEKNFKIHPSTIVAIVYSAILFIVQLSGSNVGNFESVTYSILKYNYFLDFFRNL